jgi:hypothetical protein
MFKLAIIAKRPEQAGSPNRYNMEYTIYKGKIIWGNA